MEHTSIFALLTLALGLGIVHALDADHIMAVSGLASTRANRRDSVRFCLRWAVGHAISLLTIGSCVFWLGVAIPKSLSHYAEHAIGLVLIVVGVIILADLRRKKAHVHFHQHDGLPQHAHWHTHTATEQNPKSQHHHHQHSAVIVGLLHGAAGSAPLLVLVPLAKLGSAFYGLLYLLTFSLGVLLTMLVFGGIIGGVYQWLSSWGTQAVKLLRLAVAFGSVLFGAYMLAGN